MPREPRRTRHVHRTPTAQPQRHYPIVVRANHKYRIAAQTHAYETSRTRLGYIAVHAERVAWGVEIDDCGFCAGGGEDCV